jgi:3-hydroxyacyl-CoA dehydrogenase
VTESSPATSPGGPGAAGVSRVAVVGTGLIGTRWAAYFLARGLDVTATDPAEGAEAALPFRAGAGGRHRGRGHGPGRGAP